MNAIDLRYISASGLTLTLSECNSIEDLRDALVWAVQDDLSLARSYVYKYDNESDRLAGTSVDILKQQIDKIELILNKLSGASKD